MSSHENSDDSSTHSASTDNTNQYEEEEDNNSDANSDVRVFGDDDDEDSDDSSVEPEYFLEVTPVEDNYGCHGCKQGFSEGEVRIGVHFPDDEEEDVSYQHIACLTPNEVFAGIQATHGLIKGPIDTLPPYCKIPGFEDLAEELKNDVSSALEALANDYVGEDGEEEQEEEENSDSDALIRPPRSSPPSVLERLSNEDEADLNTAKRSSSRARSTEPPALTETPHANLSVLTFPPSPVELNSKTLFSLTSHEINPEAHVTFSHVAVGLLMSFALVAVWVSANDGISTSFVLVN